MKLLCNLFYPYNNFNIINNVNVVIIICCKSVSKHANADDHNLKCKIIIAIFILNALKVFVMSIMV